MQYDSSKHKISLKELSLSRNYASYQRYVLINEDCIPYSIVGQWERNVADGMSVRLNKSKCFGQCHD